MVGGVLLLVDLQCSLSGCSVSFLLHVWSPAHKPYFAGCLIVARFWVPESRRQRELGVQ